LPLEGVLATTPALLLLLLQPGGSDLGILAPFRKKGRAFALPFAFEAALPPDATSPD
jgi:hypothetical protein